MNYFLKKHFLFSPEFRLILILLKCLKNFIECLLNLVKKSVAHTFDVFYPKMPDFGQKVPHFAIHSWKNSPNSIATVFVCKKWYFVTKIVLTFYEKKIVLVIEKNVWNSRLKAENLQTFWDPKNNLFKQLLVTKCFFNMFLEVSHI